MQRREMVNEDFRVQLVEWRIQRLLWVLLLLVMIGGLGGAFGGGPLSRAMAGSPAEPAWLEYERFTRYKSPNLLKVSAGEQPARTVSFHLSNSYLEQIEVGKITPEPVRTEVFATHTVFHFAAGKGGSFHATIQFRPQRVGRIQGSAGVSGLTLSFAHWVYP